MDTTKRSPLDRLLFATFLKGRTSSRDVWEEKGDMTPEDNQKIIEETNEIINDDSTYPFISYLSDLLAKSTQSPHCNQNTKYDSYHTARWLEYYISLQFLLQCPLPDTHLHLQISALTSLHFFLNPCHNYIYKIILLHLT